MPLNSCSIRQLSICRTGFRQFQFQRSFSPCRRNKLAANSKACLFFFPLSMESIKSTEFLCLWWHYRIRLNKMCESAMQPRGLLWLLVLTWHKLVEGRHHYRAIISCCAIILRCVPAWLKWAYTAGRSALYRYLTGSVRSAHIENSVIPSQLQVRKACPEEGGRYVILLGASDNADVQVIMMNGRASAQPCFMDSRHCWLGKSQIRGGEGWRSGAARNQVLPGQSTTRGAETKMAPR